MPHNSRTEHGHSVVTPDTVMCSQGSLAREHRFPHIVGHSSVQDVDQHGAPPRVYSDYRMVTLGDVHVDDTPVMAVTIFEGRGPREVFQGRVRTWERDFICLVV